MERSSDLKAAIQQHSARMRGFVTLLWIGCVVLVFLERFSAASINLFASGFSAAAWRALAWQAVIAIPEALFLLGLWWIRQALAAFSRGEMFTAALTRMLDRVGIVLVCGSVVRIFIVPGASRLLGFDPGYWIAIDAAGMVLAAIGLALKAIARVLRHASALQSELDEIF